MKEGRKEGKKERTKVKTKERVRERLNIYLYRALNTSDPQPVKLWPHKVHNGPPRAEPGASDVKREPSHHSSHSTELLRAVTRTPFQHTTPWPTSTHATSNKGTGTASPAANLPFVLGRTWWKEEKTLAHSTRPTSTNNTTRNKHMHTTGIAVILYFGSIW